jgi:hypothetical protein
MNFRDALASVLARRVGEFRDSQAIRKLEALFELSFLSRAGASAIS